MLVSELNAEINELKFRVDTIYAGLLLKEYDDFDKVHTDIFLLMKRVKALDAALETELLKCHNGESPALTNQIRNVFNTIYESIDIISQFCGLVISIE